MKDVTLSNQQVVDHINSLVAIGAPYPQRTSDDKTVTRDFELHPKAGILLGRNLKLLKKYHAEKIEDERADLAAALIPRGDLSTTEELRAYQLEVRPLMKRQVTLSLYELTISHEATSKPDAIDLTKAKIPFGMYAPLLDTILIEAECGNGEVKPKE